MRTCFVTEFFYPDQGSTPKLLSQLARYLKDHYPDLEIDAVTSRNLYRRKDRLAPFEDWDGIAIHRLSTPPSNRYPAALRLLAGLWFSRAAARKLRGKGYDLLAVGTNPPSLPMAALAHKRLCGTPYVYVIHDLYPDIATAVNAVSRHSPVTRLARKLQKRWLHEAARVVVLGRCMRDHLKTDYQLPDERIEVICNWADPEEIPLLPRETGLREEHGLRDRFVVLYSGNLGWSHCVKEMVDAAALIERARGDVSFVLVGDGARREDIVRYVKSKSLSCLMMLRPVASQDYPDLLASADVSLVSLGADADGLAVPCKFYSCLAAGRPIIGMLDERSEVARVLQESECGMQVAPGHPEQLAEAILALCDSPDAANRMGANARKALVERFTLRHAAERYYDVFSASAARAGI